MQPARKTHAAPSRLLASAALIAVTLTGCHSKPTPTQTKSAAVEAPLMDAPVAARASQGAPASQAVDTSASLPITRQVTSGELAQTLTEKSTFVYSGVPFGFEALDKVMSCKPTGEIAYTCGFSYSDQAHGGGHADLKILIFDRPLDFEAMEAAMKSTTDGEVGPDKAHVAASILVTRHGVKRSLPGECRQSVGGLNGPARCIFQIDPRMVLMTIVQPQKPFRSPSDTIGADIERAKSLAVTSYSILQATDVSSTVASTASPTPAAAQPARGDGKSPVPPELMKRIEDITGYHPKEDAPQSSTPR